MENSRNLSIGTQVNSGQTIYTVEKVLGKGGFGITYKVNATFKIGNIEQRISFAMKEHFLSDYCERDHVSNSVKFSTPVKDKVDESLRDFTAEALRLNTLDHPNIVAVNEVFETNDTAYYVMEYIEGKSLRQYIKANGSLGEKEALTVMTPILNAVSYLHSNRMTHLDIKPDNIMLKPTDDGSFMPILIDFGLSKHYDEKGKPTSTIRIQGCSNGYAPIEQYQGINNFSPTADVYALGATLYFLLVGKDPMISGELSRDILEKELPKNLSESVRNAIIHAMHLIKAERSQSVAQFAEELGIVINKTTSTVSASNLTQQIEKSANTKDKSIKIVSTTTGTSIGSGKINNKDNNNDKASLKKWLMLVIIAVAVIVIGAVIWLLVGVDDTSQNSTNNSTSANQSVADSSQIGVTNASASEPDSIVIIPEAPEVEVVNENVDDGYSIAYSNALELYNTQRYEECKSTCQSLLRKYKKRSQKQQLNQLINYCDTAIEAEQVAELERQYNDDLYSAERLFNQKRYTDCKRRCQSMLSNYPNHRSDINALIDKCDQAIEAAEQAAIAASRLPDKAVDLGLSVLWCDRNVGASGSGGYGIYYKFDEASAAACSMGNNWRLPSKTELEELYNKCSWSWTGSGYRVTGPNGNSIFLPAAGWHGDSNAKGREGYYWSSTPNGSKNAISLKFKQNYKSPTYSDIRSNGNSVRPVQSK